MINNKRILGVCITKIHDAKQITYLTHLYNYAQKYDYKLIIFNSFTDFGDRNVFYDDAGAIYETINYDLIDALIVHTESFCNKAITDSIIHKANLHNIPVLPENIFMPEYISQNLFTASPTEDGDFEKLRDTLDNTLVHEEFLYTWMAHVLSSHDIQEFYTLLSVGILSDSYLCLNNDFTTLLTAPSQGTYCFPGELKVIAAQNSRTDATKQQTLRFSDLIPNADEWTGDSSAYILSTIHANNQAFGYYAVKTDDFSVAGSSVKRVVSTLNLAFLIISNQLRYADKSGDILQALSKENDAHLPLDLLIEKNLFFYHFQPIIDAHTGTVFAYEALMRTDPVISMSPLEVLDAAASRGRLYDIEKATMQNTLAYINEHPDSFEDRKIFINSIPAHMLNANDWNHLVTTYGHLTDKLVIEMTEQTEMAPEQITEIRNRLKQSNIDIAIDDYGTGFSNISNLIRYTPKFVKIDHSLIEHIHEKPRIQKLVAGIIEFVHENGYYALAEGVESHEELRTMISLGSDYIQGFYLAKPTSYILREIPEKLQNEIIQLNIMRSEYEVKVYCPKEGETVSLSQLATEHFNSILIENEHVTIQGVPHTAISCPITVRDGLKTHITLRDICITTEKEIPLIDLGNSTNVTVQLEGDNEIINRGIRVPQSSSLYLIGDGSLHIHSEMLNSYGIGNDRNNSYGSITIKCNGELNIDISGENSVAIGGGKNAVGSVIRVINTRLHIECSGGTCVGIGNFDGNCIIDMKNSNTTLEIASANAVGIGSVSGDTNILLERYKVFITESGISLCGIGVLNNGSGHLIATNGSIVCDIRGKNIVCCGSDHGSLDCTMLFTATKFKCEGTTVSGIGDINGEGNISLRDVNVNMTILARESLDIGTKSGSLETFNIQKSIRVNE